MTHFCPMTMLRALALAILTTALAACGGGGSSNSPSAPIVQTAADNTLALLIDSGPAGGAGSVNMLFATVTVCQPDSKVACKTIDHVLVDTGSTGLRLLSSALGSSLLSSPITASNGLPLLNCAQFADASYAWGPLMRADVSLGNKSAANMPIQIIGVPAYAAAAGQCAVGNTAINTVRSLGANGILGLGFFQQDCGTGCVNNTANGYYYACADSTCSTSKGVAAALSMQLANPAALFTADNNGLVITLPAVAAPGVGLLQGTLTFGINTQTNNQFAGGSVLSTDAVGYIKTVFGGRTLAASYVDSGSNGLYFDSATLPTCTNSLFAGFYCPSSSTALSATMTGANAASASVAFSVSNAQTLLSQPSLTALPTLAGTAGSRTTFDWGLPFFFGRSVAFGFDQKNSALGTGPLIAF